MRKLLDGLYTAAAWLAALFMVGVLLMVLLSIISRWLGFHVPGTDAYAGYAMAGAGFMALAHTLKKQEHIRVTLIIGRLRGRARHGLEMWALSVACLLAGLVHVALHDEPGPEPAAGSLEWLGLRGSVASGGKRPLRTGGPSLDAAGTLAGLCGRGVDREAARGRLRGGCMRFRPRSTPSAHAASSSWISSASAPSIR